jgi:hypothetical protein
MAALIPERARVGMFRAPSTDDALNKRNSRARGCISLRENVGIKSHRTTGCRRLSKATSNDGCSHRPPRSQPRRLLAFA